MSMRGKTEGSKQTHFKKGNALGKKFVKGQKFLLRGEDWKRKIGDAKRNHPLPKRFGENNSCWRGGTSSLAQKIRALYQYRQWRSDVFTRDNFICKECGNYKDKIQAHHIISLMNIVNEYNIKTTEDALNCEKLWDINNGETLCIPCHEKTDNYRNK